ncbi:hypothetical protein DH2020_004802 [Rehmannia glutinosa]|uniref:very-long-chain 3-oxoacyl-CoA synthase n=1 Tax=Rehmannia glutinosa TaxID=99300 RepID=A0ABR0XQF8_REHGL
MAVLATVYYMSRPRKVYLVDFACYKPDPSFLATRDTVLEKVGCFLREESVVFTKRVLERSGLGDKTYATVCKISRLEHPIESSRKEAEMVMFGAIDELFAKTKVKPREIGIVVVNISLFNPTPSLSAMIVNRYKLRGDVVSCNLGGMGCSAGLISIDLAKRLLQVQPNTYALVMSLECVGNAYYAGNDRSKLLPNCLFRMGGAAVLLSNRSSDRQLQEEDEEGKVGVSLSRDLMAIAGEALQANITTLGPLISSLPLSTSYSHRGRGVLDELEKNLHLGEWDMEPSRMTLYRFGNTSSSSLWYILAYAEAKGRIIKGHRIWQIAFGSGFKCNSAVWRALKTIDPAKEQNPWMDEIDQFPVKPETKSVRP